MVERAFAGRQSQVNDDNRFIFQYDVMQGFVFNGHWRGRLLRSEDEG
jgi:hypothetical protein